MAFWEAQANRTASRWLANDNSAGFERHRTAVVLTVEASIHALPSHRGGKIGSPTIE
jgi:hypothetical protein